MASPFSFWFDYLEKGIILKDRNRLSDDVFPDEFWVFDLEKYKAQNNAHVEQTRDYVIIKRELIIDLGYPNSDEEAAEVKDSLYLFESFLRRERKEQIEKTKADIESIYIQTEPKNIKATKAKLSKSIDQLKNHKYSIFKAVQSIFTEFQAHVDHHFTTPAKKNVKEIKAGEVYSFDFISNNKLHKLKKLHHLLSSAPSYLSCTQATFIKAFTGKELSSRIKWVHRAKNKDYNKVSLIQFLEQLITKGYLKAEERQVFFKRLTYTFRDGDDNLFSNFDTSYQNYLDRTSFDSRIREAIESL